MQNRGPFRLRDAEGSLVYRSPTEPFRFETREEAEARMVEANWHLVGMAVVEVEES